MCFSSVSSDSTVHTGRQGLIENTVRPVTTVHTGRQGLIENTVRPVTTVHTGRQGVTENTVRPVTSDTDSTKVGDPELVPSPPGDALQEPCSNADLQGSAARPEDQPLSSGVSVQPESMAYLRNLAAHHNQSSLHPKEGDTHNKLMTKITIQINWTESTGFNTLH